MMTPRDIRHIVGPSETLWRISRTYDVSIQDLMRRNNITDPAMIKKGAELIIPNTTGPKPVIPLYPTRKWTHIVVHHTATHDGDAYTIDAMHLQKGWENGMGYDFLINNGTKGKLDGQIQTGPRWIKQIDGAHANANGMNEHGIGIALVGNFSETRVSENQMRALVFLVKTLKEYYDIPLRNVIAHHDVPGKNTECPGAHFPWRDFMARINN